MKRFLIFLTIFLVLVIVLVFGAAQWWKTNTQPVSSDATLKRFVIPKGRSAAEVGAALERQGVIKNPLTFKIYVQATGKAKKIQSGEYDLSPNLTLSEVVEKLIRGPDELWLTIPEGLRREEIAEKIVEALNMNLLQAADFREEFLKESEGKEGFLFPDTYLFARDVPASLVVKKLRQTFDEKTRPFLDDVRKSSYTTNQLLILASIIERETRADSERPVVAGILIKRLEADWPLQADATVQYAVASEKCEVGGGKCEWWPILAKEDLEINSPYNSYKFTGFPLAPIANPGISSIGAAVNPQESPYWYYLHDRQGNVKYAKTLREHNANVRRYLGR